MCVFKKPIRTSLQQHHQRLFVPICPSFRPVINDSRAIIYKNSVRLKKRLTFKRPRYIIAEVNETKKMTPFTTLGRNSRLSS